MSVVDWLKKQRDTAEEVVDRQRRKLQAKSERRDIDYASRADMARGARESENYQKYRRGEISQSLFEKRQQRAEKTYESERLAPEVRFAKGSEKIAKGAVTVFGAIGKDLESAAKSSGGRGKGKSRSSGGGLGPIDFSQMRTGLTYGGSGSVSRPDFSSLSSGNLFGGGSSSSRKRRRH